MIKYQNKQLGNVSQARNIMGCGRDSFYRLPLQESGSEYPGYCGVQDTLAVGALKGGGRVYQQTFVDTYTKVGFVKLYERATPITAVDLLKDRVIPFYEEHDIPLQRMLTDHGTEYSGNPERHEYDSISRSKTWTTRAPRP